MSVFGLVGFVFEIELLEPIIVIETVVLLHLDEFDDLLVPVKLFKLYLLPLHLKLGFFFFF